MGKSPDDLPLDDAPLSTPPVPVQDVRSTPWLQFMEEIDDLLNSGNFGWAYNTLRGIKDSVEQYQSVTEGQRRAVENIAGARRRSEGWSKRRYEGFSRGGR